MPGSRASAATRRRCVPARTEIEWDAKFGLVKINPIVDWTSKQVWRYIHDHDVPYNDLHNQDYPSIGCTHCTRAVRPGEDPRAGRWSGFCQDRVRSAHHRAGAGSTRRPRNPELKPSLTRPGRRRWRSRPSRTRASAFGKNRSVQPLHRFFDSRLLDEERDRPVRRSLAKHPYVHIGNRSEYPAGHFRLPSNVLSHKANQRSMILPSHLGDSLKVSSDFRQRRSRSNQQGHACPATSTSRRQSRSVAQKRRIPRRAASNQCRGAIQFRPRQHSAWR